MKLGNEIYNSMVFAGIMFNHYNQISDLLSLRQYPMNQHSFKRSNMLSQPIPLIQVELKFAETDNMSIHTEILFEGSLQKWF